MEHGKNRNILRQAIPAPVKKGLHGGGCGPHPRGETKGISLAVSGWLQSEPLVPRCAEHRTHNNRPRSTPAAEANNKMPLRQGEVTSKASETSILDHGLEAAGANGPHVELCRIRP